MTKLIMRIEANCLNQMIPIEIEDIYKIVKLIKSFSKLSFKNQFMSILKQIYFISIL